MNQQNLFNYVMTTPHNTNPTILKQKIKEASVQSDWNQNNPSAPDYVKNRPFWTEEQKKELLAETVIEVTEETVVETAEAETFVVGQTYLVKWDGVEYVCEAYHPGNADAPLIGNQKVGSGTEGTGEPFLILGFGGVGFVVMGESLGQHTLSISHLVSEVHKLDPKYLPEPFWVEEKKTLVIEGVSDSGYYQVQSQLEVGKEYTYCIDGIEYTGVCVQDDIDKVVYFHTEDKGNSYAIAYEYGINLNNMFFDFSVSHKIELVEKVYHTHHDFMVIANMEFGENGESVDLRVVAGDFAKAKAKILKGLPVTALVCGTMYDSNVNDRTRMNEVTYVSHNFNGTTGDEYLFCESAVSIRINPDNTAEFD